MTDIQLFSFEDREVRTLMIDGNPWWVAKDVCAILEISNERDAYGRLDVADVGTTDVRSGGQMRAMKIVNESGLYDLVLDSRKPQAKAFRKWITSEVIPSIRKTGSYVAAPLSPAEMLLAQAQQLVDQERRLAGMEVEVKEVTSKVAAIEGAHNWFTALGYAINNNLRTERNYLMRVGKKASALMREKGEAPQPRQDATFGKVNTYPIDVLEVAFELVEEN